jgi:hypothetical protein
MILRIGYFQKIRKYLKIVRTPLQLHPSSVRKTPVHATVDYHAVFTCHRVGANANN